MKDNKENQREFSEIKKIKKRTFYAFLGVFLIVVIGIGGKVYMDNKRFHDEMVRVVKSGQAKREIEIGLKNLDSKALTSEGIIKSYEIDYESIKHNPMGGVMYTVVVNQDKELTVEFDINKDLYGLKNGGAIISEKLSDILK